MDTPADRIAWDFDYHPADTDALESTHERVRAACKRAALELTDLTGPNPSREQSLMLTNLEQVMFWATAAVARGRAELGA